MFNTSSVFLQWKKIGGSCFNTFSICGHQIGPQNSWLFTQHISTKNISYPPVLSVNVQLDIQFHRCPPDSCINATSLYIWETFEPNRNASLDVGNYQFVANLTRSAMEHNYITVTFELSEAGFYLGVRDNGSCVTIQRMFVYTCPVQHWPERDKCIGELEVSFLKS